MGECHPYKLEVVGSSPTIGSVAVAQLVEQWIVNPPVASSILVGHP